VVRRAAAAALLGAAALTVAAFGKKQIRASSRAMIHFNEGSTIAGPPSIEVLPQRDGCSKDASGLDSEQLRRIKLKRD
jgi:hypothetical protein